MVVFTVALLIGSGEFETWSNKEQQQTITLIAKILDRAQTLVAPDGKLMQIGDNDSGIFLHLAPAWEKREKLPEENRRNIIGFVSAASVLLSRATREQSHHPDAQLIKALLKRKKPPLISKHSEQSKINFTSTEEMPELPYRTIKEFCIPQIESNLLQLKYFPDFGIAVWSAPNLWLSLFWGGPGQCGIGGHSHNDKLSMDLYVDGKAVLNDQGSFYYTGNPVKRNLYRSVHSHPMEISVSDSENEFDNCKRFSFPMHFSVKVHDLSITGINLSLKMAHCQYTRTIQILPTGSILLETACSQAFDMKKSLIPFGNNYGRTSDIA